MSVFTEVPFATAQAFVAPFEIGPLQALTGIAGGVENTNYFVTTPSGEYVLTLFETLTPALASYYLALKNHLAKRGFPCPKPLSLNGEFVFELCGKPAALVTRIPGGVIMSPSVGVCRDAGVVLARLHDAGQGFKPLENWRGRAWREQFAHDALTLMSPAEHALLISENAAQAALDERGITAQLPTGMIHGDLFRDNMLWDGAHGGAIDFYFACTDALAYDLAITANDFCTTANAQMDPVRLAALLDGYQGIRTLTALERLHWPDLLRRAALRTWVGRLGYNLFPRAAVETTPKDHRFSERLLREHINHAKPL